MRVPFTFLWATGARGISAGEFTCHDIKLSDGTAAFPLLWPVLQVTPGTTLKVIPKRLKTCVGANTQPMPITKQPVSDQLLCPVYWLHQCLIAAAACGSPTSALDYPMRKLSRGNKSISPGKCQHWPAGQASNQQPACSWLLPWGVHALLQAWACH